MEDFNSASGPQRPYRTYTNVVGFFELCLIRTVRLTDWVWSAEEGWIWILYGKPAITRCCAVTAGYVNLTHSDFDVSDVRTTSRA